MAVRTPDSWSKGQSRVGRVPGLISREAAGELSSNHGQDFLCRLLFVFRYPFHPRVIAVARKSLSWSGILPEKPQVKSCSWTEDFHLQESLAKHTLCILRSLQCGQTTLFPVRANIRCDTVNWCRVVMVGHSRRNLRPADGTDAVASRGTSHMSTGEDRPLKQCCQ